MLHVMTKFRVMVAFAIAVFSAVTIVRSDPKPIDVAAVKDETTPELPKGVKRLDYESPVDKLKDWALFQLPEGDSRTWAVYLHGHGATGHQLFARPDVRDGVLAAARKQGWGAMGPNLRGNAWMSPAAAEDLHSLIGLLRSKYKADRIILVGGSMGGTSVLSYAVLHPEDAAAVIALCPATDIGAFHTWCRDRKAKADAPPVLQELADAIEQSYGGPPAKLADVYAKHSALRRAHDRLTMPVFVSHGTADALIPVEQCQQLAKVMHDRPQFQYHELKDGGHDAPIRDMDAAMKFILPKLEEAEKDRAKKSDSK